MSFNSASFCPIGGGAGGTIWRYVTTDNVASMAVGTATADYFSPGVLDNFPGFNTMDMIVAVNGSTPTISWFVCSATDKANSNGISVVPCGNAMGFRDATF